MHSNALKVQETVNTCLFTIDKICKFAKFDQIPKINSTKFAMFRPIDHINFFPYFNIYLNVFVGCGNVFCGYILKGTYFNVTMIIA